MNEQYELYAKLHIYKKRVEQAREIIARGLEQLKNPYMACSFGKDSSVLLHLLIQVMPEIEVRFIRWDESNLIDTYAETIAKWEKTYHINLKILDLHRQSLDEPVPDRWKKLTNLSECDGYFIGLRADESRGRKMTLKIHGTIHRMKNGLVRISPLAWWKTDDVAAYIYQFALPTLQTYQYDGFEARTTSRIPRADYGIRESMLSGLRRRDPSRFNALCNLMPEVSEYV